MKKIGVAGVFFDGEFWSLAFAASDGFRINSREQFANNESGYKEIINCIKLQFDTINSDKTRIILVRTQPQSDQLYPLLFQEFPFPKVVYKERLKLHAKRLGYTEENFAELAAIAAITSINAEELLLESTNVCTFNCLYCTQDLVTRQKVRMTYETAKKIVDEYAASSIGSMGFHVMGEPTVNPDLPKIIGYATKLGIENALVTNASLLTRKKAEELFDNGLKHLIISVQTFGKDQHDLFKRPSPQYTYERVLENIKDTILVKWEKAPLALIELHVMDNSLYTPRGVNVVTSDRDAEDVLVFWVNLVKKLAVESGHKEIAEKVSAQNSLQLAKSTWPNGSCHIEPLIVLTFKTAGHWIQNFLKDDEAIIPASKGLCKQLTTGSGAQLAILANGDAVMCCFDYNGSTRVGNIYKQSLATIDEKAEKIRDRLRGEGTLPFKTCQRCLGTRVKVFAKGSVLASVNGELQVRGVAIYGTDQSAITMAHLLMYSGIRVNSFLEPGEANGERKEQGESYCGIELTPLNSLDVSIQAILFPPEWDVDHSVIDKMIELYPDKLIAQIDMVALNPFDRGRIESWRNGLAT